jgi:fatty-acyl-CoA synthase
MTTQLYAPATLGTQTLRALGRYRERTAFAWDGGKLTGAATLDLLGRMQNVFVSSGLRRGQRVAVLTANRAETWCASLAAQLCAMSTTFLHPLGSLDDQLDQIVDSQAAALVVDARTFGPRGGELAARSAGLKKVFTIGPADFGTDLIAAADAAGSATPRDLAVADDIAALNYTGGTTGKSKGALRRHREIAPFASAILADFEIPDDPRYLAVAPISHVAGSKVLPVLMRGGSVEGLRPRCRAGDDRARADQRHAAGPDHDLRAARSSETRRGGSLLARAPALRRLADVAGAADRGSCPHWAGLLTTLRADRVLSGLGAAQGGSRRQAELFESCGFPVAVCDVRILDDDDREVAVGQPGEICVRGRM